MAGSRPRGSGRGRLVVALLSILAAITRRVPRRAAEPFCRVGADAWWATAPAKRAAVRANLRHVLGRRPTGREVRTVFRFGSLNYWDTFAIPQLTREQVLDLVPVEGWEHVEAALEAGRGAILAGAHLSSVALAGQTVAARGVQVVGVVEPIDPPDVFDFINDLRQTFGVRLFAVGSGALREMLLALRRNQLVGLVTDRDVLGTGPVVEFFGAPTTFPDGAAVLSLRTGAPILPAVAIRLPDGSFRGIIEGPVPFQPMGDQHADVRHLTQAVARRLEYHIGAHPLQWTVFQMRWPDAGNRPDQRDTRA